MMRLRISVILIITFFIGGCDAPVPDNKLEEKESTMIFKPEPENYVIFSPMEGVLLKDGVPLVNAKIIRLLRWNENEEGLIEEFQTDETGHFSLPLHEERMALNMLIQFGASAEIYFDHRHDNNLLWYNSKRFPEIYSETGNKIEDLQCDLKSEEIAVHLEGSHVSSILTKCRWKNMPSP